MNCNCQPAVPPVPPECGGAIRRNYRSDTSLTVTITDEAAHDLTALPWRITVTSGSTVYRRVTATSDGKGTFTGCHRDKATPEAVHMPLNCHRLPPGRLTLTAVVRIPDECFPDGYRDEHFVLPTDIELTSDNSDPDSDNIPVDIILPLIYGGTVPKPPVTDPDPDTPPGPTDPDTPPEGYDYATDQDIQDLLDSLQ